MFQLFHVAEAATDDSVRCFVAPNEAGATTDELAGGGREDMPGQATDCDWLRRT